MTASMANITLPSGTSPLMFFQKGGLGRYFSSSTRIRIASKRESLAPEPDLDRDGLI